MKMTEIQPSQFYLSEEKLKRIREWFDPKDLSNFEPLPIRRLDGNVIFTDGHTRAFAAWQAGLESVPTVWDGDDLDWDLYRVCVEASRKRGIQSIADLSERILTAEEYAVKWNGWCDEIQKRRADHEL